MGTARQLVKSLHAKGATDDQIDKALRQNIGVGIVDLSKNKLMDREMSELARTASEVRPQSLALLRPGAEVVATAVEPTAAREARAARKTQVKEAATQTRELLRPGVEVVETLTAPAPPPAPTRVISDPGQGILAGGFTPKPLEHETEFAPIRKIAGTVVGAVESGRFSETEIPGKAGFPEQERGRRETREDIEQRLEEQEGFLGFMENLRSDLADVAGSTAILAAEVFLPQPVQPGVSPFDAGREIGRAAGRGAIGGTAELGTEVLESVGRTVTGDPNIPDPLFARPATTALTFAPVVGAVGRGLAAGGRAAAASRAGRFAAGSRPAKALLRSTEALKKAATTPIEFNQPQVQSVLDAIDNAF